MWMETMETLNHFCDGNCTTKISGVCQSFRMVTIFLGKYQTTWAVTHHFVGFLGWTSMHCYRDIYIYIHSHDVWILIGFPFPGLEMGCAFRRAASSGQAFFCNIAVENPRFYPEEYQWIGLRENLQETIDFPVKYGVVL